MFCIQLIINEKANTLKSLGLLSFLLCFFLRPRHHAPPSTPAINVLPRAVTYFFFSFMLCKLNFSLVQFLE